MHNSTGIWPDCRLKTNPLYWRQTVGGDNIPVGSVSADINSTVIDIYFLVWSLTRLLCCVGSDSNVAAALDRAATGTGYGRNTDHRLHTD